MSSLYHHSAVGGRADRYILGSDWSMVVKDSGDRLMVEIHKFIQICWRVTYYSGLSKIRLENNRVYGFDIAALYHFPWSTGS